EADVPGHCAGRGPRARSARMVPLQRLTHVGICVSDMDRALRFYRDCLGFRHEHELRVAGEPSDTLPRLRPRGLHAVQLAPGAGRSGGAAAGRVSLRPATRAESLPGEAPWVWGMTRYQWLVLFAAWLGWGFDVFDGLLFNLVAPVCLPRLLGVAAGDARVGAA